MTSELQQQLERLEALEGDVQNVMTDEELDRVTETLSDVCDRIESEERKRTSVQGKSFAKQLLAVLPGGTIKTDVFNRLRLGLEAAEDLSISARVEMQGDHPFVRVQMDSMVPIEVWEDYDAQPSPTLDQIVSGRTVHGEFNLKLVKDLQAERFQPGQLEVTPQNVVAMDDMRGEIHTPERASPMSYEETLEEYPPVGRMNTSRGDES